jgi:hypothetical protein
MISLFNYNHHHNSTARVLLVYKNMAESRHTTSHVGLGVTAVHIQKMLLKNGITTNILGVFDGYELDTYLKTSNHTHIITLAPWMDTPFLQGLLRRHPNKFFTVTYHSNVGFLQADSYAVRLLKEQLHLMKINHNFSIGVNSERLAAAIKLAFNTPVDYIPNAYEIDANNINPSVYVKGQKLKIGIFGAIRVQKNLLSATWAALIIANQLNVDTEITINSGRQEGPGGVLKSIQQLTENVDHVKLIETGWNTWPKFCDIVRNQHLLISPSYTESFCNVVADGISEGVPSVVSEAIHWVPNSWKAEPDDVENIAQVGMNLLKDCHAIKNGINKLELYNKKSGLQWKLYLNKTLTNIC